jgi:hypothetical protein
MSKSGEGEDAATKLWKAGGELFGAASGGAVGLVLAGPDGAIVGGAAGTAIGLTLKEVAGRILSRREKVRVGAALQFAVAAVNERLSAGDEIRQDEFFNSHLGGQSKAAEFVEGVVISAQRQHEERKVEYLGYLLGNVTFEEDVDPSLANWLITAGDELSWTQLVLLAIIGSEGRESLPEIEIGNSAATWSSVGIHEQLLDLGLGRRELIGAQSHKTPRLGLNVPNLVLREQVLRNMGRLLYSAMWLDRIPDLDREVVMKALAIENSQASADGSAGA